MDIKNLEKIEPEVLKNPLFWEVDMFDPSLVFRDMETHEIFVFDKSGIWNEDTLNHKLLYWFISISLEFRKRALFKLKIYL